MPGVHLSGPTPWPLLEAAFRGALAVPFYARLLASAGVDPAGIDCAAAFHDQVPLLRKGDLYRPDVPMADLCRGGELGRPAAVMTSSGFTGQNSFGLLTLAETVGLRAAGDEVLTALFDAAARPPLLINGFGMGIAIPTSFTVGATGPRPDLVLRVLKQFGRYFGQVVILGDPHLLKAVVDDGNAAGVDWENCCLSLFSGQDWLPETLRTYLCRETGMDPERPDGPRKYVQTMGLTELGLLLFLESPDSVRLRRAALADPALRRLLFGNEAAAVPSLFHYDPRRFHLEAVDGELVVTTLSPDLAAPLVRYACGDQGEPIDGATLAAGLANLGREDLLPRWPLPLAWTSGRLGADAGAEPALRLATLRHNLYRDIAAARAVTGHFTRSSPTSPSRVRVQLRRGVTPSGALTGALARALFDGRAGVELVLVPWGEYHEGLTLDFERKFAHESS